MQRGGALGGQTTGQMEFELALEVSAPFLAVNSNKRGITLDLQRHERVVVLTRLVATADMLVENSGGARQPSQERQCRRRIHPDPAAVAHRDHPAVQRHHGFIPKTGWIAHVKEVHGIPTRRGANRACRDRDVEPCPPEKREAIEEALRHFGVL